jgi:hypothetical protein
MQCAEEIKLNKRFFPPLFVAKRGPPTSVRKDSQLSATVSFVSIKWPVIYDVFKYVLCSVECTLGLTK